MDGLLQSSLADRGRDRDSQLALSLSAGDEHSMAEFYDRWAATVYDMARLVIAAERTTGGAADPVLATRSTFAELWRTAPMQPEGQNVHSWVLATAQRMTRLQVRQGASVVATT